MNWAGRRSRGYTGSQERDEDERSLEAVVVVLREALVFCVVETVEGKKKFRMEKKEGGKKEGESKEGTNRLTGERTGGFRQIPDKLRYIYINTSWGRSKSIGIY